MKSDGDFPIWVLLLLSSANMKIEKISSSVKSDHFVYVFVEPQSNFDLIYVVANRMFNDYHVGCMGMNARTKN